MFGKIALTGGDKVRQELQGIEGQLQKASTALKVAGVAFTAVGAAGLKFASDARNVNATLGSTAITLGVTTKELRNLLLATTNATFPIKSVAATFDILTRAGVRNTDELQKSANAFDALADATGSSAEVVADILIPALKAMGERIPQTSQELDKFTWLTKNTTTDLSEFGSVMNYVAMYGEGLNITLDDMVAIMAVLESKGKGGATATRLFRTAVTQAKDGAVTLNEALGVTTEEIDKYKAEIDAATGLTDKHGEALNKQVGFMEKVRQKFSELTLVAGSFLEPLEPILAAMTALGPVMIFASSAMGAHVIALTAHKIATIASTAAQWAFNAVMTANPIGLVIAGIVALIAAGILLWQNWDKIISLFKSSAEKAAIAAEEAAKKITELLRAELSTQIKDKLAAIDKEKAAVTSAFEKEIQAIKDKYGEYKQETKSEIQLARDKRDAVISALDDEAAKAKQVHNDRIQQLKDEYRESLSAEEKKLHDQIDKIEETTRLEDLSLTRKSEQERAADLQAAVDKAKTNDDRIAAQKELDDYLTQINRNELLRQRNDQKRSIRDQIEAIQNGTAEIAIQLRADTDKKIALANEVLSTELTNIDKKKVAADIALTDDIVRLEKERDAALEAADVKQKDALAKIAERELALQNEYDNVQKATKLHVDNMNNITAELKDRTITITTVERTVNDLSKAHPASGQSSSGSANGGLLKAHDTGGLITEPTWLTRVGESSPYGIMAEKRPEFIVPQGSASVVVTGNTFNVRQTSDIDKIAEAIVSRIRLQQGVKI